MKHYELTYLVSPKLSEEQVVDINEKINTFIQDKGGILGLTEKPKQMQLAYPIKKFETAWIISNDFYTEKKFISELKKIVEGDKNIIRYLVVGKESQQRNNSYKESQIDEKYEVATTAKSEGDKRPKKDKASLEDLDKKLEELL